MLDVNIKVHTQRVAHHALLAHHLSMFPRSPSPPMQSQWYHSLHASHSTHVRFLRSLLGASSKTSSLQAGQRSEEGAFLTSEEATEICSASSTMLPLPRDARVWGISYNNTVAVHQGLRSRITENPELPQLGKSLRPNAKPTPIKWLHKSRRRRAQVVVVPSQGMYELDMD
jgi:hypothetical protein